MFEVTNNPTVIQTIATKVAILKGLRFLNQNQYDLKYHELLSDLQRVVRNLESVDSENIGTIYNFRINEISSESNEIYLSAERVKDGEFQPKINILVVPTFWGSDVVMRGYIGDVDLKNVIEINIKYMLDQPYNKA